MTESKQFRLASRPTGEPKAENWNFTTEQLPELKQGEVLVKIQYISLDPAMRGWMNEGKSYIEPVKIGDVMRANAAGEVVASENEKFSKGDTVIGALGVQSYAVSNGKGLTKVDTRLADLPTYLGTLGMPGMTAYFGLLNTGQPKAGETVLVSGAAGAVGSVVGQIAKIKGCKVVGIAGGEKKCSYIKSELGFDEAIDYKNENIYKGLKRTCPDGVDVYFDNVGGEILDAALAFINLNARIVICGAISQYNATEMKGPKNYLSLLVNRARMEGIVVFDNARHYKDAATEMAGWMQEGKLRSKNDIVEGIETFPETLMKLFTGDKLGKLVLKV
jgi:NADPH-dependent curcumin reductase CurA